MSFVFETMGRMVVQVDGRDATVTQRRERNVLALLLVARGRPVSVGRLIEELWDDDPPESAMASIQVAVCRLRTFLDPDRSGPVRIERSPAGYELVARRDEVDVWHLEDVVRDAFRATTLEERLLLATQASDLWHGEPFAECTLASVRAEAARLTELMVSVHELRGEVLLSVHRAADAVRLLRPLSLAHPYREELWALLARAQYACARQADALSTLATLRLRLAEDLGVDPSTCVRVTEQRILAQDAALVPSGGEHVDSDPARRPRRHRSHHRLCRAVSVTRSAHALV